MLSKLCNTSRHILAFLLCLFLLSGSFSALSEEEILSGVSDNQAPTITNILLVEKGKSLHVGDTVHVTAQIEDLSAINDPVSVTFASKEGTGYFSFDLSYISSTNRYEGQMILTPDLPDGEYILYYVHATDEFYNYREIGGTDFGTFTLTGSPAQSSTSNDIKFSCVLSETGKTIKPGDKVHIAADFTGNVDEVCCVFCREDNSTETASYYVDLSYNDKTKKFEGEYSFSAEQANGIYRLHELDYLSIENDSYYLNLLQDNYYVILEGASQDTTAPTIKSMTFLENKKTLGPEDELHIKIELEDNSPISDIFIDYKEPRTYIPKIDNIEEWNFEEFLRFHEDYGPSAPYIMYDIQQTSPNIWEYTAKLDKRTVNERYDLSSITIEDVAGNIGKTSYSKDQYWFRFDGPDIPPQRITDFVTRCYQIILGRDPDEGGLNTWAEELFSGRKAAAEIIEQFVSSAEFQNKKLRNSDSVEILYKAMLGRGSDPAGKASWVEKLDAGQDLTAVINGFCGSAEFKAICNSYGIQPGTVTVKPDTPNVPTTNNDKIKAYVERCYQIILGRNADEGGLNTWINELNSGRKAAAEIIEQFVSSAEFQNKKLSNSDSVEILYKAMLGRGSDPAGKASWVEKLNAGQDLTAVINGFCGSAEFKAICDSYGIQPGTVTVKPDTPATPIAPTESDEKIKAFVARCYKIILGRDADEGGMNTWAGELQSRRKAAAEIIEAFINSQEFQNKKYSNPDAVEILYKAMLGRGSDPAGKADWVAKLNNGQPLTAVINGFCGSAEFKAICDAYGITPGSVQVQQLSSQPVVEEEPVAKQTVTKTENNVTKVEIVNPSDTENAQLGTAVQAIYINEEKAKEFIGRCYRCILGREASQSELDGWIGQMLNGTKTADQIARGFLFSGEFKDKNVSNDELVKILYRVYLNREADAEGLETWTQKLDEGISLNELLNIFSTTNEFNAVIRSMVQ